MSLSNQQTRTEDDVIDDLTAFLGNYYAEEMSELAQRYNSDGDHHIKIDWSDLFIADTDVAEDYLNQPDTIDRMLTEAVRRYEVPNYELSNVDVRVVGLNDSDIYQPIEIDRQQPDGYIGVRGELKKVTSPSQELKKAAYECGRCGTPNHVLQTGEDEQKPHDCQGCERQGPFTLLFQQSEFEHYCKVRVETPPDESGELQNDYIDGYVRGSLVWEGHEDHGLITQTGKSVTVYGTVGMKQKQGKNVNERLFDTHLLVDAIEFGEDDDEVNIEEHKDEFTELANRPDAVDVFAESLVPELYATPEWERALELLVAYLFGSPRIDVPNGPTYRGDIHVLIMSDFGMGKSMVNSAVAMYSPKCIKESVTGMSSDVGLLAAAVEDDFGEGQWTLQPGILVRANGGHVILDEIDKTDANLERMNDALEGEQMVQVNKAGQRASYKSRIGLLATGNPEGSRFNEHEPVSDQLNVDQSLLSRFDGIVTMTDTRDTEQDGYVAETQTESYIEAQEYEHGDREELDTLAREVPANVGRAWIAYARQEINPTMKREHIDKVREFYAEDIRKLNDEYADNTAQGQRMPVPVSARAVGDTIRFAVAFARCHLRDTVALEDVERAMKLQKSLVGQTFDSKNGASDPRAGSLTKKPQTQSARREAIRNSLSEQQVKTPAQVAEETNIDESTVRDELESMKQKNPAPVIEPSAGVYRGV